MSDEIVAGGVDESVEAEWTGRRLVGMRFGDATLYVEAVGELQVDVTDEIYTVAPSPAEAFRTAMDAIGETVRAVGDRLEELGGTMRPEELTVEFSISFDAKGKAAVIPIFVTGESGVQTGLKVTAKWEPEKTKTIES